MPDWIERKEKQCSHRVEINQEAGMHDLSSSASFNATSYANLKGIKIYFSN